MLLTDPSDDDRSGPRDAPPPVPGYVLESLLGRGASGEVWRAAPRGGGPPVAVKLLVAGDPVRQSREAALLGELDHPHLVRLHEVVHQPRRGGAPRVALVLDLLAGGSLAALLARRGRLRPGEVVTAIAPVAAALAHVHDRGVVHGDLSPGNIVFTEEGRPVLTDLGVARVLGDDSAAEVTPAYVDPTVARGGAPGPASDVFGVAAAAFHALTGVAPWNAARPADVLAVAAAGELPDLDELGADAPAGLRAVIARGLAAEPHARGSAAEFALDLRHACRPEPVRLPADSVPDGELGSTGQGPRTELTHQVPGRSPRPAPVVVDAGRRRRRDRAEAGAERGSGDPVSPDVDEGSGRRRVHRVLRVGLVGITATALIAVIGAGVLRLAGGSAQVGGTGVAAPTAPAAGDSSGVPRPSGTTPAPTAAPATAAPSVSAPVSAPVSGTGPAPGPAPAAATWPASAAEWQALVDGLYRTRARALTTASTELLGQVYTRDSPHRVADEGYVAALAAAGGSLRGFAPQVVRVDEVVTTAAGTGAVGGTGAGGRTDSGAGVGGATGEGPGDGSGDRPDGSGAMVGARAELRLVDRWPGYTVVPAAGDPAPRAVPGRPAAEVRMVLVAEEGGWRIERAEQGG